MIKKLLLIIALALAAPSLVSREAWADIAADDARDVYTGNGSTTSFTYNFKILTSANIAVYQAGTLKTLTTHYTLTGVGNDAGGTVVFVTAPANGEQVLLMRNQPINQTTSYIDGSISASTIERDFDRQTSVNQQQQEEINRGLKYPKTITPTTALTELPAPVASKCLGYDGAGTALANLDCGGGGGLGVTTSAALRGLLTDETGTGAAVFADSPTFTTRFTLGTCAAFTGAGSPEGVVTAPACSIYFNTTAGASTTFYAKESGVGNTGWVPYGNPAGSGAPTSVPFITTVADGGVSAEFALGSLATGLLKNTTTTGIPTIAVLCTDYLSPACPVTNSQLPSTITGRIFDNTNTYTGWDSLWRLQDNADPTKQMAFELSGNTTGLTRTYTPPNADTHLLGGSHFNGSHTGRMLRTGSATYAVCRDNFAGTVSPAATDDTNSNYCVGSLWVNTTASPRTVWTASNVTAAAAVWVQSGVSPTPGMQAVSDVDRAITNASSFATGFHIGLSATSGWRIYESVTLGGILACVGVAGVENACDWKRKIDAGFVFELQDSTGAPRFTFAGTGGALTNVTLNSESTGNVLTTPSFFSINAAGCNNATAAAGMDLPTANAPTPLCHGTTTTQGSLTFADGATQTATRSWKLRADWIGTVDVKLVWFANSASANAVRWGVATGCVADSEAVNVGPSYNAQSTADTAYTGTANQRKTTSFTGVAVTNCAAGESMTLQVQRIGAHANDTLAASAELLQTGVTLRNTNRTP